MGNKTINFSTTGNVVHLSNPYYRDWAFASPRAKCAIRDLHRRQTKQDHPVFYMQKLSCIQLAGSCAAVKFMSCTTAQLHNCTKPAEPNHL